MHAKLVAFLLGTCLVLSHPAWAVDYVSTEGPLSDRDFYRLVSCGARPGSECDQPPIRWPSLKERSLTIGIAQRDAGFPDQTARHVLLGMKNAVRQINRLGSGLRLNEVGFGETADILVYLQDVPEGGKIQGTGLRGLDGIRIEIGRFHVLWDHRREITRAGIVLSRDLEPLEAASVILEEIVQSLGLIYDIRNVTYRGRSIFDEDSNRVVALRGQDAKALRLHYPARGQ